MDPDANILRQRELAALILNFDWTPESDARVVLDAADELAELVQALDEWRLKGRIRLVATLWCVHYPSNYQEPVWVFVEEADARAFADTLEDGEVSEEPVIGHAEAMDLIAERRETIAAWEEPLNDS